MAVAVDAASEGTITSATTLTVSHTCSGADRVLFAGCTAQNTVTGATYNGVTMAELYNDASTPAFLRLAVFRLVAPATGANNIVFSFGAATGASGGGISFTGVDAGDPEDANVTEIEEDVTSSTMDVASATDDYVVDFAAIGSGTSTAVPGAGQTERIEIIGTGADCFVGSTKAGAGTVAMLWDTFDVGPASLSHWAVNVNASAGGGGGLNVFLQEPIIGGSTF